MKKKNKFDNGSKIFFKSADLNEPKKEAVLNEDQKKFIEVIQVERGWSAAVLAAAIIKADNLKQVTEDAEFEVIETRESEYQKKIEESGQILAVFEEELQDFLNKKMQKDYGLTASETETEPGEDIVSTSAGETTVQQFDEMERPKTPFFIRANHLHIGIDFNDTLSPEEREALIYGNWKPGPEPE